MLPLCSDSVVSDSVFRNTLRPCSSISAASGCGSDYDSLKTNFEGEHVSVEDAWYSCVLQLFATCSMAGNVEVDIHHFKTEWYEIFEEVDITWCLPHPYRTLTANVRSVPFIKTRSVNRGAVFMLGAYRGVDVAQRDRCACCNSDRALWRCTECWSPVCAHCIDPRLKELLGQCKDCPSVPPCRLVPKDEIEPQAKRMPSLAYRKRLISEVKTESAAVSAKRRRPTPVEL